MYAVHPLEAPDRLGNPELPLSVSFFYGDRDWMDHRAGRRVVAANRFSQDHGPSQVYIVEDSDHHMYLDNPEDFAELIIEDMKRYLSYEEAGTVNK